MGERTRCAVLCLCRTSDADGGCCYRHVTVPLLPACMHSASYHDSLLVDYASFALDPMMTVSLLTWP